MRVFELAKELERPTKDLIEKLQALNAGEVRNHMSVLTAEQVAALRGAYAPAAAEPSPAEAAHSDAPVSSAPDRKVITVKPGFPIIVREFAEHMGVKPNLLIAELMKMNIFASINQKIEMKIAQQIAAKWEWTVELEKKVEVKPPPPPPKPKVKPVVEKIDVPENIVTRPPVVVFMGHVDHGKTSLLDKIRNSRVAAGEDGGITQHIGAYTVTVGGKDKHKITFLDTPGHEAFTAMRARGANLTDIAVIVIDGVDGIMPQTKEAIQHAQAAKVAIMVALNKKDLRAFNGDRVKQQLQALGINPEDWGGDVICCPVSALNGDGIPEFLENIIAQAEILELKANPRKPAQGFVVEARMEPGMGPTATLLLREGTLKVGDAVLCGLHWGRIKALINDRGERVKSVGPSDAVKCLGLSGVPEAGAEFTVMADEKAARAESDARQFVKREESLAGQSPKRASLEDLFQAGAEAGRKTLSMLLKVDTQGSLEALQYAIGNIKSDKVDHQIVLAGIGNINVNDVLLASASKAIILGFHVSKDTEVSSAAKREGVEVRLYSIIYEMLDELKELMQGLLEPIVRETILGHAQVKQLFDLGKKGKVAGCIVTDGRITARGRARVKRRGDVLYEGSVSTLRRFQNEAAEVREGQECGLRLDHFGDFEPGDVVEVYEVEKIAQQL
ncbi:MAG TPA: translation initiation factor IF-2 [Kiritimatiellia bacterium]|nr:translation initiation factor IF-2 [Kiritimatiellia bacterium]